ncbi:hypothetical protein Tco_0336250 [Tanacetum coccineum]
MDKGFEHSGLLWGKSAAGQNGEVSLKLFFSGLKVYHLPPALSVCEDAYSTKACSGSSMQSVMGTNADLTWGSDSIHLIRFALEQGELPSSIGLDSRA